MNKPLFQKPVQPALPNTMSSAANSGASLPSLVNVGNPFPQTNITPPKLANPAIGNGRPSGACPTCGKPW